MIASVTAGLRALYRHDVLRFAALMATAAFLLDWATKSWALRAVEHTTVPLGALMLAVERNDAFAFSAGAGQVPAVLVVGIRLAALCVLLLMAARVGARSRRVATGFALLFAGGLGNAADILFRGGAVVDLIHAGPLHLRGEVVHAGVVFNGADVMILLGLGLLAPLIHDWSIGRQRRLAAFETRVLKVVQRFYARG